MTIWCNRQYFILLSFGFQQKFALWKFGWVCFWNDRKIIKINFLLFYSRTKPILMFRFTLAKRKKFRYFGDICSGRNDKTCPTCCHWWFPKNCKKKMSRDNEGPFWQTCKTKSLTQLYVLLMPLFPLVRAWFVLKMIMTTDLFKGLIHLRWICYLRMNKCPLHLKDIN